MHEFVPMKRSQASISLLLQKVKASACCLVSRRSGSVSQNLSSNNKSPGVRVTLKCGWNQGERSTNSGCYSVEFAPGNREHVTEDSESLSETSNRVT